MVPSWWFHREVEREKERERRGGGGGSKDRPGCRRTGARSSISGTSRRRVETRGVLAWRVNDSVRLILQLQLEIAKMDEPVDRWERTPVPPPVLSPRPPFFDLHPSPTAEIRSQGCHGREIRLVFFQLFFFSAVFTGRDCTAFSYSRHTLEHAAETSGERAEGKWVAAGLFTLYPASLLIYSRCCRSARSIIFFSLFPSSSSSSLYLAFST